MAQERRHQKDCTRSKIEHATQRIRPLRNNLRTHHEGKRGTKDLGGKRPLYVRKKKATGDRHRRMELKTAITSGKRKTDLQDPQEGPGAGICEARKRDMRRVSKN
jgi:hypothetical protein